MLSSKIVRLFLCKQEASVQLCRLFLVLAWILHEFSQAQVYSDPAWIELTSKLSLDYFLDVLMSQACSRVEVHFHAYFARW